MFKLLSVPILTAVTAVAVIGWSSARANLRPIAKSESAVMGNGSDLESQHFHVHCSILTTTAVVLLQQKGHADPMANAVFRKRAEEIEIYFRTILGVNESPDGTPAKNDAEYIRKMINRLSYTLATDGNYILSDHYGLATDWRQYNAFVSIAERAMVDAIVRHGVPQQIADDAKAEFNRILKEAEDFLETPRWAVLHNSWSQEELAFQIVKFGEYLADFDQMLDQSIASIRANDPDAGPELVNQRIQTQLQAFARQYGAASLKFYAGMIGDIHSADSPMNAISECFGTVAYNAPVIVFQVEYDPGDEFDAMTILQAWWANPVVPAK